MTNPEKEIEALKDELLKANEEIKRLATIKSDFISLVSHELRTPITSVKESVSLVLDGITGPLNEEQKNILTIAKNNIQRLVKLIVDILDISKLEAGRVIIHKRKLNINSLIKDIYEATKLEAEQKNVEFGLSLEESIEFTWFDPDRIGYVLKSLVSNAIKFSGDKKRIKIYSSKENINSRDFIKIIVEDNGIGIPPESMENLFRNFSPLDAGMTRKYGGAGLGLSISKGLIELHGGNIWAVSEPGLGSRFIFTIPIYKKHEEFDFLMEDAIEKAGHNDIKIALIIFEIKDAKYALEGVINETEDIIRKTVRGPEDKIVRLKKQDRIAIIAGIDRPGVMAVLRRLKNNIKVPLLFGVSVYPDESMDKESLLKKAEDDLESGKNLVVPKKTLLIIDDEEALTSMLSFRLKGMGFNTITAGDGDKGVKLAKKNKPDLILLDLKMPKIDGFEVSKRLKQDSDTRHIPILVFSALANKNTKESIVKLNASGFIEKPFEPELLVDKINEILEVENRAS